MYRFVFAIALMFNLAGCSESPSPSATGNAIQPDTGAQKYLELKSALPGYDAEKSRGEVIEFFSYACDHCARFNPELEKWKQTHPTLQIRKIPVLFGRAQFETLARLYFSLQDLGYGQLDEAVFAAIHQQNRDLSLSDIRRAWAKEHGISADDLEQKMSSAEISHKVSEADELAAQAQIDGVPTLVVGGKYTISLDLAESFENMLGIADTILATWRAN